ncbi:MAG: hypothetical protein AB1482_11670 [Pseudomonadota bacterium]
MREHKKLWARVVRQCIVGGSHHEPGELLEVDSNTYRQLLADALAVPAAPARPEQQIRPYEETTHE